MYLRPRQHLRAQRRDFRSKWYEDLLGLHTYDYRPGWAAFMSADHEQSHEVALMQVGDDAPLQQKGQVGLNHMAWLMESLDDLKEFYGPLKEKGVNRSSTSTITASRSASICAIRTATASRCCTSCRAPNGRSTTTSSRATRSAAAASRGPGTPRWPSSARRRSPNPPRRSKTLTLPRFCRGSPCSGRGVKVAISSPLPQAGRGRRATRAG